MLLSAEQAMLPEHRIHGLFFHALTVTGPQAGSAAKQERGGPKRRSCASVLLFPLSVYQNMTLSLNSGVEK